MQDGSGERLVFIMETEATAEPPKADVRSVEGVVFVYGPGRRFGETAPTNVVMGREDFPKEVGHVCSAGDAGLAVPCLAIGGTQPLYERAGIEAVMSRLRDFLRDAKVGALMADGWEPVPFAVDQVFTLGEISPRFFQEYASANPAAGGVIGLAVDREEESAKYVVVLSQEIGGYGRRPPGPEDHHEALPPGTRTINLAVDTLGVQRADLRVEPVEHAQPLHALP